MAVARPARSERAGIDHELARQRILTGHHVDSAVLQNIGSRRWLLDRKFLKPACPRGSKQPNCFFPNGTSHCFKVSPVEQHRSGWKGIEQLPRTVTSRVKYSPTVIISELGNRPCSTQGAEEVERVGVVVGRLFKVHAVGSNLAFCFAQDNLPSKLLPSLSQSRTRTQSTNKKEAYSFAQEVRIG